MVATTFTYDAKNRLDDLYHRDSTTAILAQYLFGYNAADEITSLEDIDGTTTYGYDDYGQLTAADHTDGDNPDEDYAFDTNGNRTDSHLHDDDYVTGANNRLLSNGVFNYEYDKEGNLIRRTEISTGDYREFTWDHRNRLTSVIDKDSSGDVQAITRFTYDALGRRISKTFDDANDMLDEVLKHFVYDGASVILDFVDDDGASGPNDPVLAARYLHGPAIDQILAQEDSGGVHWLLSDHLGSIKDVVDNTGDLEKHRILDSFGNVIDDSNPILEVRYAFTGRELDPETGLYYYRARYYDATNGRFISEDPIGFAARDTNLSRYVRNEVLRSTDPYGLFDWDLYFEYLLPWNNPPAVDWWDTSLSVGKWASWGTAVVCGGSAAGLAASGAPTILVESGGLVRTGTGFIPYKAGSRGLLQLRPVGGKPIIRFDYHVICNGGKYRVPHIDFRNVSHFPWNLLGW